MKYTKKHMYKQTRKRKYKQKHRRTHKRKGLKKRKKTRRKRGGFIGLPKLKSNNMPNRTGPIDASTLVAMNAADNMISEQAVSSKAAAKKAEKAWWNDPSTKEVIVI